jgi:hypothetical protein
MSAPISGLNAAQRAAVRQRAVHAAVLSIQKRDGFHYTKDERRWEGIDKHLSAARGQVPSYGDCSSSATWWLWNGLWLVFGAKDTVNGQAWKGGYTGTILETGKHIPLSDPTVWLPGDLMVYGRGFPGKHVAMYLGGGFVASHGSEGGPYKVTVHYRSDLMAARRAI